MSSARDRLEQALARIADPKGEGARACLTVYAEAARAAADAADARAKAGISLGPLDGAIVSIKDLFDVTGEPTRAGSKILRRRAARQGRCAGGAAAARGRRGDRRQDQHERVRVLRRRHEPALRHAGQSGGPYARVRAAHRRAPRSPPPTRCAKSRSAPTPAARPAFPARCAASSATSRAQWRVPTEGAFPLSYTLDSIGPIARSVADCAQGRCRDGRRGVAPLQARAARRPAARRAAGPAADASGTTRSARASARRARSSAMPGCGSPTSRCRCSTRCWR